MKHMIGDRNSEQRTTVSFVSTSRQRWETHVWIKLHSIQKDYAGWVNTDGLFQLLPSSAFKDATYLKWKHGGELDGIKETPDEIRDLMSDEHQRVLRDGNNNG